MNEHEINILLLKIKSVYQSFNITNEVTKQWFKALMLLSLQECDIHLTDFIDTEKRYPVPADITERHRRHIATQKAINQDKYWTDIKCFVCMDKGFELYTKTINDYTYQFASYCSCESGNQCRYDGQKCKNNQTNYYVKPLSEVLDTEELANRNAEKAGKPANLNKDQIIQDIRKLFNLPKKIETWL